MAAIVAGALPSRALEAQRPVVVTGRVVRRAAADTLAAAQARVVLHRVSREVSGALDSTRADAAGRFRFELHRDTALVYLLSARWSGIEYFSEPLPGGSLPAVTTLTLLVADTSSTASAATVGRFLVLGGPGVSRDRRVVDLFVLRNNGTHTLVGRTADAPTWRAPLPRGVTSPAVGAAGSDISPEAVRFAHDSVSVIAPLAPGEKQLLIEYTLPAALARLEFDPATRDSVQVVAEEPGVTIAGLQPAPDQVLDGRQFSRWAGRGGSAVLVTFPVATSPDRALLALVVTTILVTAAVAVVAVRLRARPPAIPPPSAEALIERIAQLDLAHRGRDVPTEAQRRYQVERAALKRALTETLRQESPRGGL